MKTIGSIIAILALLSAFFGAYRFMEGHYALADELKRTQDRAQKIEERLDFKIADDKKVSFQKEMREIEERNLGKTIDKWDQRDRKRYNELKDQLASTLGKIEKMM
jgi:biopolymer transport protein ExbB/TolQ